MFVSIALLAATLFVSSARIDGVWAWALIGLYLTVILINAAVLLRYRPESVAARASLGRIPAWDRVIGGLFALTYTSS